MTYLSYSPLDEVFGAEGVQLCIDAGIPLNKDLITHLIEDVVAEKVRSLLGHPKRPQTALKVFIAIYILVCFD